MVSAPGCGPGYEGSIPSRHPTQRRSRQGTFLRDGRESNWKGFGGTRCFPTDAGGDLKRGGNLSLGAKGGANPTERVRFPLGTPEKTARQKLICTEGRV